MAVLGRAIASYLSQLGGLYSVELPEALNDEITELVLRANQLGANRAIYVSAVPVAPGSPLANIATTWREILAWRTTDDRVFVWQRGLHEPDSSFQSVVRPFISGRFPGAGGGECSVSLLVQIGIGEVWTRKGLPPVGDVFEAFVETAQWVFDVLLLMFEESGSTPGMHWSDRCLVHWARLLDQLDAVITAYAHNLVPRHAWEIVRLAGLPLPSAIVEGNPFHERPPVLLDKDQSPLAALWADIVSSFILRDGGTAELLSALDRLGPGPPQSCAWRNLDWSSVRDFPVDTPAPVVGARVLGSSPSPSLITQNIQNSAVITVPSWWGVSTDSLDAARRRLREQTALVPEPGQSVLLRPLGNNSSVFVLNTRIGVLSHAHTPAKWRARVTISGVRLRFKEDWNALVVSATEPATANDGDAWINPESAAVKLKGAEIENQQVSASAGDQVLMSFSLVIEYSMSRDRQTGVIIGSWSPERSLVVSLDIRSRLGGQWERSRKVESELEVIVPCPLSPTIIVSDGGRLLAAGPETQDKFSADPSLPETWHCETTPTLLLDEEGRYEIVAYDGTLAHDAVAFRQLCDPWISEAQLPTPTGGLFPVSTHDIDDGVIASDHSNGVDVLVFRVKERSGNLSSGLLSAVRRQPAGRRPPSNAARTSVLGQFQDSVTQGICGTATVGLDSLFQYVILASTDPVTWSTHTGGPAPVFLFDKPTGFTLPGIGNGPSDMLVATPAWTEFMSALSDICSQLGLRPGNDNAWMSGLDVNVLSGNSVKRFVTAHAALIGAATSLPDRFWASYPFSIIVIEGRQTADFGQLRAVFLSPLHPARLAWSFAVTKLARNSDAHAALLGLVEGWNFPSTGTGVNPAGQPWPLVAIPTDPGIDQDFAAWSALAVLGQSGVADLPLVGGGQSLPWGGRTGINARVVERAIRDYLVVHPHVNALEVDVRSVGTAPRSREIDDALLRLVGAADMDVVSGLGGGAKVWDALDRQGMPPNRDMLFAARRSIDSGRTFEWKGYSSANPPVDTDVALIENATVHLAVVPGTAHGVIGILPLRRFAPSDLQGLQFDQNFLPRDDEDILGLATLLREIEGQGGTESHLAIRALPQAHALGIGQGAQWEVLGTFNIDPSLLATLVATSSGGQQGRLLWEWRPSWMPAERTPTDLARRPYYVIARIPASLSTALHSRQGISTTHAAELLRVLGQRGIGLAVLNAEGGTQESAAAGYFYAIQLLSPATGHTPFAALPAEQRPAVYGILPVDPVEPILEGLAGKKLDRRADLLSVACSWKPDGTLRICIVPVEVKHHGMPSQPEELPSPTHSELKRAREQLRDTVHLLRSISKGLAESATPDGCAGHCIKRLAFATLIDLAMSFSATPPSALERSRVLGAIVGGPISVGIGDPVLLWFAPSSIQFSGNACVIDPHQPYSVDELQVREIYVDPSALPDLWWENQTINATVSAARTSIDQVFRLAFAQCERTHTAIPTERDHLRRLLGIGPAATAPFLPEAVVSTSPVEPTDSETSSPTADAESATAIDESNESGDIPMRTADLAEAAPAGPAADSAHEEEVAPPETPLPPDPLPPAAVGWSELSRRYTIVGKLVSGGDSVAIDLDHPKTVGIFGYMGSGKSYLLGTLIESAVMPIPRLNSLPAPLAVVIFNYRRNASDRFELASLALPNSDPADVERLATEYQSQPQGVPNVHVLCLPGELRPARRDEYGPLRATELFFNPTSLDVEDWELLMGEPGSEAVFARTIRATLADLRQAGDITLDQLDHQVMNRLTGQSRAAARLRLDFVRKYMSVERGIDFADVLKPGSALIVDLRQPLFNKDDALRFFLVCANQISRVQGRFNKMIVFDEAHEYLSDAFGERMESRIRLMRHEGTSYVFATQDVRSIPSGISRFLTTRFVFNLGTRDNLQDLEQTAPEFRGMRLLDLSPGHCLVQANASVSGYFQRPREIRIRPRVTQHGGISQIFHGTE